jgi:rhamnosyltransferase subunit B
LTASDDILVKMKTRKIVLNTFGSLGDLHPYVALALELRERGYRPIIAANNSHRPVAEAEGIEFRAVRPDVGDFGNESELMKKVMDLKSGPEYVIRQLLMPNLSASYADLNAACEDADLLVTHPLTLTAPLVAEKRRSQGMAWASVAIAPSVFLSAYDPPVFAPAPWLIHLRAFGPRFYRGLLSVITGTTRSWVEPWHKFRSELGLPPTTANPMFSGQFSPELVLALFSPQLAQPQPDWPQHTTMTGFPFYDRRGQAATLDPALDSFLEAGDPPIVFTLGSSAVMKAEDFYAESAEAAKLLDRRAVLLVGCDPRNRPQQLPSGVVAFEYAPFSALLSRASAIVHQGGVGTTAQAMRAGRPMLVVPFGFDQPDNAARVQRLGISRTLARTTYNRATAARELSKLLSDNSYAQKANQIGIHVQKENGALEACNAMESLMRATNK